MVFASPSEYSRLQQAEMKGGFMTSGFLEMCNMFPDVGDQQTFQPLFRERYFFNWTKILHLDSISERILSQLTWRTNLWIVPSMVVFAFLVVFLGAQLIDYFEYEGYYDYPSFVVDMGSISDLESLLTTLITSIIPVLALVLSVMVVIFILVLGVFGQRLLRRFIRDRQIQVIIGFFAGTIVFGVLTLLSAQSRPDDSFVPWLSGWLMVIFSIASLALLLYFIHHVGVVILINNVLKRINDDIYSITLEMNKTMGESTETPPMPYTDAWRQRNALEGSHRLVFPVFAHKSGYVKYVRWSRLVFALTNMGACAHMLKRSGNHVIAGSVIALVEMDSSYRFPSEHLVFFLDATFRKNFRIGPRRTLVQDQEFGILQTTEIGLRAMSPAINDVFTMISCIDFVTESLAMLLEQPVYKHVHMDTHDWDRRPRVVERKVTWSRLCATAFDHIRQITPSSTAVMIRVIERLTNLVLMVRHVEEMIELNRQAELTKEGYSGAWSISRDLDNFEKAFERFQEAMRENMVVYSTMLKRQLKGPQEDSQKN